MATTLRDWHVALVDEDGDPINAGNPLHVTATVGTVTGTLQSTTVVGQAYVAGTLLEIKRVAVNMTSASAQDLVAAVALKKIRVVAWRLWADANCELEWLSAATVLVEAIPLPARAMQGGSFMPGFWRETVAGEALRGRQPLSLSPQAATIRGTIEYVEV